MPAAGRIVAVTILDGWPTLSLAEVPVTDVTGEEFRNAVLGADSTRRFLRTAVSPGGQSDLRLHPIMLSPDKISDDLEIQSFLRGFCGQARHVWQPSFLYLIDAPCFVVSQTGVVIMEGGKLLTDTIFKSTGQHTIDRMVGGDLNAECIAESISRAEQLPAGNWAPLSSRWSDVYFHALTESLAQDVAFNRAKLSDHISYILPSRPRGAQATVFAQASSPTVPVNSRIVKVPRVVFSSMLYQHAAMGGDFLNLIEHFKSKALADAPPDEPPAATNVYISRLGARARPMTNETDLIACLKSLGFSILQGDQMSFNEQVRAVRSARNVVGAHGAGLTNAAFAPPGALLFELRSFNRRGESPTWTDAYRKLASIMGFAYCTHVSRNPRESEEWEADIPRIVEMLQQILSLKA